MRDTLEPSTLAEALRAECVGYRALVTVLEAERDALAAADADALPGLAARKLGHVSSLQAVCRTRDDGLARAGYANMAMALATEVDGGAARAEWAMLLSLAAKAKRLNDVNGRVVARLQRHFDGALCALLHAAGLPPVYGADGRPDPVRAPREIATI